MAGGEVSFSPAIDTPTAPSVNPNLARLSRGRVWWLGGVGVAGSIAITAGLLLSGSSSDIPKPPPGFQAGLTTPSTDPTSSANTNPTTTPDPVTSTHPFRHHRSPRPDKHPPRKPGIPLSFHFVSKGTGLVKDVNLLPMTCPEACPEVNGGPQFVLDPPSYWNLYWWKTHRQTFQTATGQKRVVVTGDKRIIAGHTSEIAGVALAAQWFQDIRRGDTLTMDTSTGDYKYVAVDSSTTHKQSNEFQRIYQSMTPNEIMLLTCAVTPANDKNTEHIFRLVGPVSSSPTASN